MRGRERTRVLGGECLNGHNLTMDNIYVSPSDGYIQCRICMRKKRQERNATRRYNKDSPPRFELRDEGYVPGSKNPLRYPDWVHIVPKGRLWLNTQAFARLGGCRRVVLQYDVALKWVKIVPSPDPRPGTQVVNFMAGGGGRFLKLKHHQAHAFHVLGNDLYFARASDGKYYLKDSKYFIDPHQD